MTEPAELVSSALANARLAQARWVATPLEVRLQHIRHARHLIAEQGMRLAEASARCRQRPTAEALAAEVLPLAGACRFLERHADRLLAPRRLPFWTRPIWLTGVGAEVRREPFGVVLIIGPGNYPLLLPGVQLFQALAAGNAVLLKPAPGGADAAQALLELLRQAGFETPLLTVLPDTVESAQAALRSGVDKVVFTGSAATGEAILAQLAPRLTPATMELSGCDAVFIRADADLDLVVNCLRFGLQLNDGATCLGPRRVFVPRSLATELERRLVQALGRHPRAAQAAGNDIAVNQPRSMPAARMKRLLDEALSQGARVLSGSIQSDGAISFPLILAAVPPSAALLREPVFDPVLSLISVHDDTEALALNEACPYALGATIFSRNEAAARVLTTGIRAGGVVINDMIAPTVDPRLPFGGRDRSGFGVTRGEEGLLDMTTTKVITWNRARWRIHLHDTVMGDAELFAAFLKLSYGRGDFRGAALRQLWRCVCRRIFSRSAGKGRNS